MKNNITRALFIALLAISLATRAQANPWWWWPAAKAPVKTVQLALPSNNGVTLSVTVPLKGKAVKRGAGGHGRTQDATANRIEDERIAAELERHF